MIQGGYILQPRIIKDSDIAHANPCIRELWNYLIREANHSDKKHLGYTIKRGQLFRTYKEIMHDLRWYSGFRTETYTVDQMKKAMAALREALRVTSHKAPGGMLITICNYDYYQDPKNYESTTGGTTGGTTGSTTPARPPHDPRTIYNNKNDKNDKNVKKKEKRNNSINSKPSSEFKECMDYWFESFKQKTGLRPVINGAEGAALKKILKHLEAINQDSGNEASSTELFKAILDNWDNTQDKWIKENITSLTKFYSQLNNIITNAKKSYENYEGFREAFERF